MAIPKGTAEFAEPMPSIPAGEVLVHILSVCNDLSYFLRHRRFVVDRLAARGHSVTVVAGGSAVPHDPAPGTCYFHMEIQRFMLAPRADAVLASRLLALMRRERPNTVHLITLKPAVIGGLLALLCRRLSGRPARLVLTLPGLGRLLARPVAQPSAQRIARALTLRVLRFLSHHDEVLFTFETAHDRDLLCREGMALQRSIVFQGAGVDPAVFFPAVEPKDRTVVRVLFASRLLWAKGLDAFLQCAARLRLERRLEFIVAGINDPADPDRVDPSQLAQDASIVFLGQVDGMADLIRSVDLVCLPTRYGEGIPRILIEAAACGVASIASDVEGCREIVKHEETGLLIKVADVSDMSIEIEKALRHYLAHPELIAQQGAAAACLFRRGEYTEARIAAAFEHLLCGGETA